MSDNVISLVSSSEEEDGDDTRKLNSKSVTIKKKKIKPKTVLTEISRQKTKPNILKQMRPESMFVQNNNNQTQKVTVIHGFKNRLGVSPLAAKGVKPVDSKVGKIPSAITVTPVDINSIIAGTGTGIGNANHSKLNMPKPITPSAATPKTNAVSIIPKIIGSKTISPTRVDAPPASSTVTPALNSKDNAKKSSIQRPAKRIHPIKISDSVTVRGSSFEKSSDSDMMSHDSVSTTNDETVVTPKHANAKKRPHESLDQTVPSKRVTEAKSQNQSVPLNVDFQNLLVACKEADKSDEVKKITDKLKRYYSRAHSEYVNSNAFRKLVNDVTHHVKTQPKLMFLKLIDLMEELKTRRTETIGDGDGDGDGAVNPMVTAEPPVDPKEREKEEKRALYIKKMSDTLQKMQVQIRKYEQSEVDWDDEGNSHYMITERLKERAYKIYVKLCEYTGESRNAERTVKKPIKFNATDYPEFNKKLANYVNENAKFPDMFDVLRIMDHCNSKYGYRLDKQYRHSIAQVAFVKIGELLQERRKRDFYELVQYHESSNVDPAREDESLQKKLEANHKFYSRRMDDVIDKYTMRQRSSDDEDGRRTPKNVDKNASTSNGKTKSTSSKDKPATSSASTVPSDKSPEPKSKATTTPKLTPARTTAPPPPQLTKMDIALDINDDDETPNDLLIIPDDVDLTLMDDEEMQEIENTLFPTITSVTSLHPGNNEQFNELLASPLENGGVL